MAFKELIHIRIYINDISFSIITQMVMGETTEPNISGEHKVLGSGVHPNGVCKQL